MQANKEISLRLKELAKIRRKIRQNKIYAFRLSLEDPQDFDSNPFQDEIEFLKLQELQLLQEIQYLKYQANFAPFIFSYATFQGDL